MAIATPLGSWPVNAPVKEIAKRISHLVSWNQVLPRTLLIQAILHSISNFPRDDVSNTWVIGWDSEVASPDPEDVVDVIHTHFYNNATQNVRALISGLLVKNEMTYKVFDMSSAPPREPQVFSKTLGTLTTTNAMPEEVAVTVSFRSDQRLNPRHRGRIFFGPVRTTALSVIDGRSTVASTARAALTGAYATMWSNMSLLDGAPYPAVWSRVDGVRRPVFHVYVDDAFDTVRRRGPRPITRTDIDLLAV